MDIGQVVAGRYRLTERLGGGGMGVVWQAHDERLRRTVAVKEVLLPPGLDESRLDEIRRRTMREGRIAAKLHHPQVIGVYDVIEDDGRPYIVMEYLPSTSLSRVLTEKGPLPPREAARIGAQTAAALASAHAAGVVHRDVKPANILVGDDGTVKLTDFGVSRVVEDVTGTSTGTFVGTPAYLAPEVAQGRDVTFAADAYSLGATLYTAVEGAPPAGRSDNPMLLLHRIASGEIVPPKQAGPLAGILVRLLNADPEARPTVDVAKAELAEIAEGRDPAPAAPVAPVATAPMTTPAPPTEQPTTALPTALPTAVPPAAPTPPRATDPKRRRALLALAALFVLVAVTTTLITINANQSPPEENNAANPPASESSTSDTPTEEEPSGTTTSEQESTEDTSEPSDTPSTSNTPSRPPQDDPAPPAASPVAAITSYYALMPGNLEQAWTRLTPKFQESPAGGWEGYTSYWNAISSVRASQASGQGSVAEVTLDYAFKDGRQIRERHRYGLVDQNGTWLIDTVAVLSSTTAP
jgi:eukaryotic-like serine/threonine-protein kinase